MDVIIYYGLCGEKMNEEQKKILLKRESSYLSVGVTESGEGYCMIPIPWENTATAYNMKIPNVYISKDDLFDEKLMAKLKEYKVIGFYFDVPLDDYSFLKNFSIFAI